MEARGLTPRWGQRQMIAEIANALALVDNEAADDEHSPHCVIEAGTGTGKTIAYAVAAIPLAQSLGKTLVISTATIALQEQLVHKDLPDIRRHSGLAFDFVLAKGRRRYVCLSRLDKLLGSSEDPLMPLYPDEVAPVATQEAQPVYEAMIDALGRGEWDGDRDNWSGELADDIWFSVTTDHSGCSGRRCPNVGQCSFFKARDALQSADVIVTNHDLVLSDLALGGGAILTAPQDTIYVFDEGHHLPAKALNHFSAFCRLGSTLQWLQECREQLVKLATTTSDVEAFARPLEQLQPLLDDAGQMLDQLQQWLPGLPDMPAPVDSMDRSHLRFPAGRLPAALIDQATPLARCFASLQERLQRISDRLEDVMDGDLAGMDAADAEGWLAVVGAMVSRAEGNLALWSDYAAAASEDSDDARGDSPVARWINVSVAGGQTVYELRSSPVLAAEILEQHLWPVAAGVVATSATMTALNSFERFILHAGVPRSARFKVVPSPFDHARARLLIPAMTADPGDAEAHTANLVDMLPEWLDPAEGSLVLFASRRQLNDVYAGLPEDWRRRILLQGDYSKQEILRQHREAIDAGQGSVIFGLASFAEGVDLPGNYCTHVLIAKIPFAVPDSPLEASLSEWVEQQGRNAFMEITVPDAALRLVQAAGRLLRTEEDSGRITICDRRLVTRRYGRALLDALPPFRLEVG
ncbi:MAG: ATP-dependent DNA helicase DinG [Halieaceae bacterium]|nr:ATP-dependent DNA helicase DinG [Halieaceae bacterium]